MAGRSRNASILLDLENLLRRSLAVFGRLSAQSPDTAISVNRRPIDLHVRKSLLANGRYDTWAPRVYGYVFGKHVVGTRTNGTLYNMDATIGTDYDGNGLRRLRIPPPLWAPDGNRITVSRLEVLAESGLGNTIDPGSNPQVMLRTSEDGKTWSAQRMASAGKLGDYRRRVFWTRCGSSLKLWVPEIVVSDPIPWRLSGATIQGGGFQQVVPVEG